MKPAAMAYDHQLLLVIVVRTPAATVAAMAAAPQIAARRHGPPRCAAALTDWAAPMTMPAETSTCAARTTVLAMRASPVVSAGWAIRVTALPRRDWAVQAVTICPG